MCFRRGHPFLKFTLKELVSHFNSSIWGLQGPKRVSASAKKYCNLEAVSEVLEGKRCTPKDNTMGGFSVLHHSTGILLPLNSASVLEFDIISICKPWFFRDPIQIQIQYVGLTILLHVIQLTNLLIVKGRQRPKYGHRPTHRLLGVGKIL